MIFKNPLKINDWNIKSFLFVVLFVQLLMGVMVLFQYIDLQIPILRQVIGLVYVMIPGFLILRILGIHNLSSLKNFLYASGISLSFIMFSGILINTLYPLIGIHNPISLNSLILTFSSFVIVLSILSYLLDKGYSSSDYINTNDIPTNPLLFLCLVPFISIFATYIMNNYHENLFLMILFLVVSVVAFLVVFDKIPKVLYPFSIFVISISLLFSGSLMTNGLVEWSDLSLEYHASNLVYLNSIWIPALSVGVNDSVNAMLSVTLLIPIISYLCNLNIIWIFKIICPLIFSLLPLGLYMLFKEQTNEKISFLACLFFMFTFSFFIDMLGLVRQQIAEIFLVLIMLMIIDKKIPKLQKSIFMIIFCFSLVVSHYAISYIFILTLFVGMLILIGSERYKIGNFNNSIPTKSLSLTFLILFIVFALSWYIYVSNSFIFFNVVKIIQNISGSMFTELFNPSSSQGLSIVLYSKPTLTSYIYRGIYYLTQFFIVIGIIYVFKSPTKFKFNKEFLVFAIVFLFFDIGGLIIPNFASTINTSRLYHITILLLSPFCVIGGLKFLNIFKKLRFVTSNKIKILTIFFSIYLLFNAGVIYEIDNNPTSFSLDPVNAERPHFDQSEIVGVEWLNTHKSNNTVYVDFYNSFLMSMYLDSSFKKFRGVNNISNRILGNSYVFFGRKNIQDQKLVLDNTGSKKLSYNAISMQDVENDSKMYQILTNNQIYDSLNTQIFLT